MFSPDVSEITPTQMRAYERLFAYPNEIGDSIKSDKPLSHTAKKEQPNG